MTRWQLLDLSPYVTCSVISNWTLISWKNVYVECFVAESASCHNADAVKYFAAYTTEHCIHLTVVNVIHMSEPMSITLRWCLPLRAFVQCCQWGWVYFYFLSWLTTPRIFSPFFVYRSFFCRQANMNRNIRWLTSTDAQDIYSSNQDAQRTVRDRDAGRRRLDAFPSC